MSEKKSEKPSTSPPSSPSGEHMDESMILKIAKASSFFLYYPSSPTSNKIV